MLNHSLDVEGDFLVVDFTPHEPTMYIRYFSSLDALENFLYGVSGPINPFCGFAVPFLNGEARRYSIVASYQGVDVELDSADTDYENLEDANGYVGKSIKWLR